MAGRHLMSRRVGDEVQMMFILPAEGEEADHEGDGEATIRFSRTALGITYPGMGATRGDDAAFICVVGERIFHPRGDQSLLPERYCAVIDEREVRGMAALLEALVSMKDTFLTETVFCPDRPTALLDTVRQLEGLSHYRTSTSPLAGSLQWDTFVDVGTTANIRESEIELSKISGDIGRWLTDYTRDPDTGQPILDGEARPVPRLFVLRELNTQMSAQGLDRGAVAEPEICTAIWLAASGLENSRPRASKRLIDVLGHAAPKGKHNYTGY